MGRFLRKLLVLHLSVPLCYGHHKYGCPHRVRVMHKVSTPSFTLPTSWMLSSITLRCHQKHCEDLTEQCLQNISFIQNQERSPRHIYHLPLLDPLKSEQKTMTTWDKTGSGSIWGKGTWAWFRVLGSTSGSWWLWKQMKCMWKHKLVTERKST